MKKLLKVIFAMLCVSGILLSAVLVYTVSITAEYSLDVNKLNQNTYKIEYLDVYGKEISTSKNASNYVKLSELPNYVKNAFIAVEDKRFYSHNGIDAKAMLRAVLKNVTTLSFKQGGSTISQQLIKNTHLSHEKTIKRKLIEIKLTNQLEEKFSKDEILEIYLNNIYFGENSYGLYSASKLYFNKSPNNLTVEESALLAGIINAPSVYSPFKNVEMCKNRRNIVLKLMQEQGYITNSEYSTAIKKDIELNKSKDNFISDYYIKQVKNEFDEISEVSPYNLKNCKIYTYYEPDLQKNLSENNTTSDISFNAIAIKENGKISAYFSNSFDDSRQVGSTIKPLCSYAPAIEENIVSECTPILDEKTNFNGYQPSNFGEKYNGYISVNQSLMQSSNVCAVKLLNYVTPKTAVKYLNKVGINTTDNDKNLSLALGATENGITLKTLTNAYVPFINNGTYTKAKFIDKITINGQTVYKNLEKGKKVYSNDTCQMINFMLENTAKNGTAKKLGTLNKPIAGKTGTVGTKNGNSDAYCVSYTTDYILGVRLSGELENNITGGGLPANISYNFWNKINKYSDFDYSELQKIKLDSTSYQTDHALIIADDFAPERYTLDGYFRKNNIPQNKSERFSKPKVENPILTVNKREITIKLCQIEYVKYLIYRKTNDDYTLVFDSKNQQNKYEYKDVINNFNNSVVYKVVPYIDYNEKVNYGKEIILGPIKIQNTEIDNWWE